MNAFANRLKGPRHVLRFYLMLFRSLPLEMGLQTILSIINGLLPVMITILWKQVFDDAYEIYNQGVVLEEFLYHLFFLGGILVANTLLLQVSGAFLVANVDEKINIILSSQFYKKSLKLPLAYYENHETYNLSCRAHALISRGLSCQYMNQLLRLPSLLFSVIGIIIVVSSFSMWMVVFALLSVIPTLFARILCGDKYYRMKKKQIPRTRKMNYLWSLLTNCNVIKEMRVYGFESYLMKKWEIERDAVNHEEWEFTKKEGRIQFYIDFSRIMGYGLGIVFSSLLLSIGRISPGAFGASISAFKELQTRFGQMLRVVGYLYREMEPISGYFEFIDMKLPQNGSHVLECLREGIKMENVTFQYPNSGANVLKNINIEIRKGEKIALVGENGSGKTTLAKLVLGLYNPTDGKVMYDNLEIGQYKNDSIYRASSVIFQNYIRYLLTIRENVGIGNIVDMFNEDVLDDAIKKADACQVLEKARGKDNQLGREFDGIELSGGEWQRLAIARCFVGNNEIVVLDEPTASLDPITEAIVFRKFFEVSRSCTAVIISHRVGSAKLADRIIVLKDGHVVEQGSHDELMKSKGEYLKLYAMQAQWYD